MRLVAQVLRCVLAGDPRAGKSGALAVWGLVLLAAPFWWSGCTDLPSDAATAPGITARARLAEVEALAEMKFPGAKLMSVRGSNVGPDGRALVWRYLFAGTQVPWTMYWFHATHASVQFDSTAPPMVGGAIITHSWFDSDVALHLAEVGGGSAFRQGSAEWTIEAAVGEPLVPDPTTYWWIDYRSGDGGTYHVTISATAQWERVVHNANDRIRRVP